jgi:hypothetical protein
MVGIVYLFAYYTNKNATKQTIFLNLFFILKAMYNLMLDIIINK